MTKPSSTARRRGFGDRHKTSSSRIKITGTSARNVRLRCPAWEWATTKGENPKIKPPAAAARSEACRRSHHQAVQLERAGARIMAALKLATGPNNKVIGANTTPRAGIDVFHIAFTPDGALT